MYIDFTYYKYILYESRNKKYSKIFIVYSAFIMRKTKLIVPQQNDIIHVLTKKCIIELSYSCRNMPGRVSRPLWMFDVWPGIASSLHTWCFITISCQLNKLNWFCFLEYITRLPFAKHVNTIVFKYKLYQLCVTWQTASKTSGTTTFFLFSCTAFK